MALPFFFTENLISGDHITLSEEASKHCVQVLRMKTGEYLQLTDGKGNLFTTRIINTAGKRCIVVIEKKDSQPQPSKRISIAISLLKNTSRFEWFLEKATEIGVREILPIICQRTEREHFRFDRMRNVLIAAMLQSQQTWLPVLSEPQKFEKIIELSTYGQKLIAYCSEREKHMPSDIKKANEIQILIGPEGDFTNAEIELAMQNNFQPVSLGATRLRTETAGVVAAALLINLP
jgi:16S rRNA (uracil1498-N3)-methyltransferase